jgi:hypothetical protein
MSTAEKGYAQTEELGAQFIVRELDLAISHCEAGMTSRSGARRQRCADNARRTLRTAAKWKERLSLNASEREEIARKMGMLLEALERMRGRRKSSG